MESKPISSTQILGAKLLREIETEETTLEELLTTLRTHHPSSIAISKTGNPTLNTLIHTHGSKTLSICGRSLPLVYNLIITLMSAPYEGQHTLVVVDLDSRFSPSHLLPSLELEDLKHIYVFRPTKSNLAATLSSLDLYMLNSEHASKGREWKGTFVLGGSPGAGGIGKGPEEMLLVGTGWRGWLRGECEEVAGFGVGVSGEEAWAEREQRWDVVAGKGWRGVAEEGVIEFI
ncbi:hypothetical protein BGZ60DRAFT_522400 [Tricladium varicosporioides]|nr:hypothetical protein BGZ60DRAFT_522400 [Hymenoscyphus varicosporioides]